MTQTWPAPPAHQNLQPARRRRWPHVVGYAATALIGIGIGGAGGSNQGVQTVAGPSASTVTATSTTTVTASAATPSKVAAPTSAAPKVTAVTTITDGTWTVGDDIPPGTYKVSVPIAADQTCYWAITKTGSNGEGIVANDFGGKGRPRVTLKRGQDFETNDCGVWQKL